MTMESLTEQRQKFRLAEIQRDNARILFNSGVATRAFEALVEERQQMFGGTRQDFEEVFAETLPLVATSTSVSYKDGLPHRREKHYQIGLKSTNHTHDYYTINFVTVGSELTDLSEPERTPETEVLTENGFDEHDFELVQGMILDLEAKKASGELPNLAHDLTDIYIAKADALAPSWN